MVVWERLLSQRHILLQPLGSQFSSVGWASWVLTSTRWSGLASTRVFVENRPRSGTGGEGERQRERERERESERERERQRETE